MAIKLKFLYTNNMAEYEACIFSLEATLAMNIRIWKFMVIPSLPLGSPRASGGNESGVGQIQRELNSTKTFCSVSFNYVSSSRNQFADALANLSSMIKIYEETDLCVIIVETYDRLCTAIMSKPMQMAILGTMISEHSSRMVVILN